MSPELAAQVNQIAQHRDLERIDEAYGEMIHYNETQCNCPSCQKQTDLSDKRYFEEVGWYDKIYNEQSTAHIGKHHVDYDFLDSVTENYDSD